MSEIKTESGADYKLEFCSSVRNQSIGTKVFFKFIMCIKYIYLKICFLDESSLCKWDFIIIFKISLEGF
jgi:hypothetical protein